MKKSILVIVIVTLVVVIAGIDSLYLEKFPAGTEMKPNETLFRRPGSQIAHI